MLDKKLNMMLETADTLTADDLDCLRSVASVAAVDLSDEDGETAAPTAPDVNGGACSDSHAEANETSPSASAPKCARATGRRHAVPTSSGVSAGEYERQRTRESKVSTTCVGRERERHEWWPVGTELVGRMGSEVFAATVVENKQVKSGRSILITSGAASGRVCLTPTRAAIEATEDYRQANNLGRGGGVTNGWEFWQPRT